MISNARLIAEMIEGRNHASREVSEGYVPAEERAKLSGKYDLTNGSLLAAWLLGYHMVMIEEDTANADCKSELLASLQAMCAAMYEARRYIDLTDENGFAAYTEAGRVTADAYAVIAKATGHNFLHEPSNAVDRGTSKPDPAVAAFTGFYAKAQNQSNAIAKGQISTAKGE